MANSPWVQGPLTSGGVKLNDNSAIPIIIDANKLAASWKNVGDITQGGNAAQMSNSQSQIQASATSYAKPTGPATVPPLGIALVAQDALANKVTENTYQGLTPEQNADVYKNAYGVSPFEAGFIRGVAIWQTYQNEMGTFFGERGLGFHPTDSIKELKTGELVNPATNKPYSYSEVENIIKGEYKKYDYNYENSAVAQVAKSYQPKVTGIAVIEDKGKLIEVPKVEFPAYNMEKPYEVGLLRETPTTQVPTQEYTLNNIKLNADLYSKPVKGGEGGYYLITSDRAKEFGDLMSAKGYTLSGGKYANYGSLSVLNEGVLNAMNIQTREGFSGGYVQLDSEGAKLADSMGFSRKPLPYSEAELQTKKQADLTDIGTQFFSGKSGDQGYTDFKVLINEFSKKTDLNFTGFLPKDLQNNTIATGLINQPAGPVNFAKNIGFEFTGTVVGAPIYLLNRIQDMPNYNLLYRQWQKTAGAGEYLLATRNITFGKQTPLQGQMQGIKIMNSVSVSPLENKQLLTYSTPLIQPTTEYATALVGWRAFNWAGKVAPNVPVAGYISGIGTSLAYNYDVITGQTEFDPVTEITLPLQAAAGSELLVKFSGAIAGKLPKSIGTTTRDVAINSREAQEIQAKNPKLYEAGKTEYANAETARKTAERRAAEQAKYKEPMFPKWDQVKPSAGFQKGVSFNEVMNNLDGITYAKNMPSATITNVRDIATKSYSRKILQQIARSKGDVFSNPDLGKSLNVVEGEVQPNIYNSLSNIKVFENTGVRPITEVITERKSPLFVPRDVTRVVGAEEVTTRIPYKMENARMVRLTEAQMLRVSDIQYNRNVILNRAQTQSQAQKTTVGQVTKTQIGQAQSLRLGQTENLRLSEVNKLQNSQILNLKLSELSKLRLGEISKLRISELQNLKISQVNKLRIGQITKIRWPVVLKQKLWSGQKKKSGKLKLPTFKINSRYSPSIAAQFANIRGKMPKSITGLEIRPIVSGYRKGKK